MCFRASLFWVILAVASSQIAAADDSPKPSFKRIEKFTTDLEEKQAVPYRPAFIRLTPGDKADRVRLFHTHFLTEPAQRRAGGSDAIVAATVLYLIELRDEELAFGADKILARGVADRRETVNAMVALIHSNRTVPQVEKDFEALQARYAEIGATAFKAYAKSRGYEIERTAVETNVTTVTLVTSPTGGRICLLSAFEYELCRLAGKDPNGELGKSVLTKTEEIKLAGRYYYQVDWPDGKKSKVGTTTFREGGKHTLP